MKMTLTQTTIIDVIGVHQVFLPLCCAIGEAGVDKKQHKKLYLIYFSDFFQWTSLMLEKLEWFSRKKGKEGESIEEKTRAAK